MKAEQQQHLAETKSHWEKDGLADAILAALKSYRTNLDGLTTDELAPLDQFHGGGKRLTVQLAQMGGLKAGMNVLDIGGGVGGAARTLATEFGCRVTVLELTDAYIQAGRMLTSLMKLQDQVTFCHGNALELPFDDSQFDAVWTQNSGMNIADKPRLYAGIYRVLRPGGIFATQEPMAGPNHPPIFPVMWSRGGANHFLLTPVELRRVIEASGFRALKWLEVTGAKDTPRPAKTPHTIQSLVMGDDRLAEIRRLGEQNEAGKKLVMFQGVFEKPKPAAGFVSVSSKSAAP